MCDRAARGIHLGARSQHGGRGRCSSTARTTTRLYYGLLKWAIRPKAHSNAWGDLYPGSKPP